MIPLQTLSTRKQFHYMTRRFTEDFCEGSTPTRSVTKKQTSELFEKKKASQIHNFTVPIDMNVRCSICIAIIESLV